MADKFWKAKERRFAKKFKTERIGVKQGNNQPDFITETVVGEIFTADPSKKLLQELGQAELVARKTGKLPIAIMSPKGGRDMDALVFMRFSDFMKITPKA